MKESLGENEVLARARKNGIIAKVNDCCSGFNFYTASHQLYLGKADGVNGAHDWLFGFEGACVAMLEDRLNPDKSVEPTCPCKHGTTLDRVRKFLGIKEKE